MAMLETVQFLRAHGLAALRERFALKLTRHGRYANLVHLKYDQIHSPMAERVCHECRGLILDEADDWRVVSFPFSKFWNHGEPLAADIDWDTARVDEKLDGSLMVLFPYRGEWLVSSSGTADACGDVWGHRGTFADLFWETWRAKGYHFPDAARNACYMFELMTPYNRVVVRHRDSRLVCHGARDLATLEEFSPETVAAEQGWECVPCFPLTTVREVVDSCAAIDPLTAEGYVVRDARFNRIKVKSPQYVALTHLKDSSSPRRMLDIVRSNEGAEWLAYFPELAEQFEVVRQRFDRLCDELTAEYERLRGIPEQKAFAAEAKKSRCSSPLFAMRAGKCKTVRDFFAGCTLQAVERATGMEDRS